MGHTVVFNVGIIRTLWQVEMQKFGITLIVLGILLIIATMGISSSSAISVMIGGGLVSFLMDDDDDDDDD